jgi:hypothetical protein
MRQAREQYAARLLFLFLGFDIGRAFVRTAFRAEAVWLAQGAALRACDQVNGRQGVMGAAAIAAALR